MESSLLQIQPNGIAILWTRDGKISFQSWNYVTLWHGEFTLTDDESEPLIAMFDCFGKRLKSHVLHCTGIENGKSRWVGLDYCGSKILGAWGLASREMYTKKNIRACWQRALSADSHWERSCAGLTLQACS